MAVLVTGVGYLGAALVARLLRAGERVVGLDNGFATDLAVVARLDELGDFQLIEGSVTSPRVVARVFARGPFAVVYHLAAQASAPAARQRPLYAETTNLTGPRIVLDAAGRHSVPRVVYASSMRVYGPVLPPVVDETTPYGPQSDLVHLSQVYGEKLLELYTRGTGITAVAIRLAVVYGRGPVTKRDYRYLTVPNKYCLQAVRGEPLAVYPGAATPTAFLHVDDAAAALHFAGTTSWPAGFHPANASGEVRTIPEVAALVTAEAQARGLSATSTTPVASASVAVLSPLPSEGKGGEGGGSVCSPHYWGAGGAASSPGPGGGRLPLVHSRLTALGWRPTRTLADSVGDLIDYYRLQERA